MRINEITFLHYLCYLPYVWYCEFVSHKAVHLLNRAEPFDRGCQKEKSWYFDLYVMGPVILPCISNIGTDIGTI